MLPCQCQMKLGVAVARWKGLLILGKLHPIKMNLWIKVAHLGIIKKLLLFCQWWCSVSGAKRKDSSDLDLSIISDSKKSTIILALILEIFLKMLKHHHHSLLKVARWSQLGIALNNGTAAL